MSTDVSTPGPSPDLGSADTHADADTNATADAAVALVRQWLAQTEGVRPDASAARLAGLLQDEGGLAFAIGFVDRVARPDDLGVAARNLEQLAQSIPNFLPWLLRALIAIGGPLARLLPWPIVPIARRVLRGMVGHLVIDATPSRLGRTLEHLRADGDRLNLNLLGEAVLGDGEADRRLAGITELVTRPDVDYVSVKVSAIASQLSMWAFDEAVDRVVDRLVPLYETAALGVTPTFLNLDMEEFRDLDLTIEVFQRLLDRPSLRQYEAGIVLQAYLPEALPALDRLTAWAQARRAAGGAGIKVRVVKGANLAMERVDAALHGWPVAVLQSKQASDANYKRVLDAALRPDRVDAVRIGVAGHNLFDIAWAWQLAEARGVASSVEVEMLLGMAPDQAAAVRRTVGHLLLYTPVVHPRDFDSAISYLIRRLEENASTDNFLSGVFELTASPEILAREEQRFRAALADLAASPAAPAPHRVQNRLELTPVAEGGAGAAVALPEPGGVRRGFANEPDTDPALPANREWGRAILARSATSTRGQGLVDASALADGPRGIAAVERIVAETREAGAGWAARSVDERAGILHAAGRMLAARRADLLEVMAAEAGKTLAEGDPEVSEAIDFAHYYAESARDLAAIDDATFTPVRLTVVVPPWNFPVAISAGGVLAPLAAGSAVIIKPAPQTRRSAAVMVEALWDAGVPRDVLRFVDAPENEVGQALIAHPAVDRLVLTGAWETAALFRSWRPDLPVLAETSGKNAIVITPSADLDLAVADLVRSAFGHAGQKCSAASLAILVGSVATSERFERQLVDAVRTLRVGRPTDPTAVVGPLVERASGTLLGALTALGTGEQWLVEPRALDASGELWSPGVKRGVLPGSAFHTTEYFGPVLGLMRARDLDEALDLQNGVAYGLTAGLHSLDAREVAYWLDHVEAGNLYVNRGITGAIVRRQPFGGWKRSSVGGSTKAGGPSYVMGFGSFAPVPRAPKQSLSLRGLDRGVRDVLEASQPGLDFAGFDAARAGALSDQRAWEDEFGVARDDSRVEVLADQPIERNVLRYRPAPVTVRAAEGAAPADLVRVLLAATRAGSPVAVSAAAPLPASLLGLLDSGASGLRVTAVVIEPDTEFAGRVAVERPARIRVIAPAGANDPHATGRALLEAVDGDPDVAVWSGPVTASGRVELLPFLREQAVSITAHRFGNPYPALAELPL
ncbi:proline dehydrogenase family protein [Microcella frigidaquae]|uniref:L-glutamate gamma-semialdehyde dehydrogenase n=1 Tax=Microcella frigidaquae TaxID=424758 RepID=A0A840X5U8_9MICO|nr:proline dehydrogenase family protein [Microcella frigidaquae]MBB5617913.1 RHH-type proline utilization regulon transcriptional repressor/proline dehydrogenase/delta 1-pyrroline-5-carboxylate dehydrogenase [Microcella frigidaquae]NHN44373.1 aldehyde dehydrogenase family protein [Microcella frigidaquae]